MARVGFVSVEEDTGADWDRRDGGGGGGGGGGDVCSCDTTEKDALSASPRVRSSQGTSSSSSSSSSKDNGWATGVLRDVPATDRLEAADEGKTRFSGGFFFFLDTAAVDDGGVGVLALVAVVVVDTTVVLVMLVVVEGAMPLSASVVSISSKLSSWGIPNNEVCKLPVLVVYKESASLSSSSSS